MANTPFKMKGFSGFGNSPMKHWKWSVSHIASHAADTGAIKAVEKIIKKKEEKNTKGDVTSGAITGIKESVQNSKAGTSGGLLTGGLINVFKNIKYPK